MCLSCLEERRPKGIPRPFTYVPSIEARIKAGWQPPNQRRAALRQQFAKGYGSSIATARQRLGWSQSDLGRKLDRSQNLISLWERGIKAPGPGDRARIQAVLRLGRELARKGGAA